MLNFVEVYNRLLAELKQDLPNKFLLVGILSGGDLLAKRLAKDLTQDLAATNPSIEIGSLDISLYRDDINIEKALPNLESTVIPASIDDSYLIIVDDVIQTGRTVRAALDALSDFGRPKVIKMAALVNLENREVPIACDYSGAALAVTEEQQVSVLLSEVDEKDAIVISEK